MSSIERTKRDMKKADQHRIMRRHCYLCPVRPRSGNMCLRSHCHSPSLRQILLTWNQADSQSLFHAIQSSLQMTVCCDGLFRLLPLLFKISYHSMLARQLFFQQISRVRVTSQQLKFHEQNSLIGSSKFFLYVQLRLKCVIATKNQLKLVQLYRTNPTIVIGKNNNAPVY